MIIRVEGGAASPRAVSRARSRHTAHGGEMAEAAEAVSLGPVVGRWEASRSLVVATGLVSIAMLGASIWRLAVAIHQLLAGAPGTSAWGLVWGMGLVAGVVATIAFAALAWARVHVHEHGLVVRALDGVRALTWEAVRAVRCRSGALLGARVDVLELDLVHGEVIRLLALEELPLLAALIESSTGARRRLGLSRD